MYKEPKRRFFQIVFVGKCISDRAAPDSLAASYGLLAFPPPPLLPRPSHAPRESRVWYRLKGSHDRGAPGRAASGGKASRRPTGAAPGTSRSLPQHIRSLPPRASRGPPQGGELSLAHATRLQRSDDNPRGICSLTHATRLQRSGFIRGHLFPNACDPPVAVG